MYKNDFDKEITDSLDKLNPTEEQSKAMWERLSDAIAGKEVNKDESISEKAESKIVFFDNYESRKRPKKFNKILTRVAAAVIVVVTAFCIDKAAGGHVYAAIKDFLNIDQGRQDVVGNMEDDIEEDYNIYAPAVYHMDGDMIVFGGLRGLIIYDLKNEMVMGNIDTQKIGCVYYNSGIKASHVVKDGDRLVVFNEEDGEPFGDYYIFDLTNMNGGELVAIEQGNDKIKLESYSDMYEGIYTAYVDTHELAYVNADTEDLKAVVGADYTYSEFSYAWKNDENQECYSFLSEENGEYVVYTYNTGNCSVTAQAIDLSNMMNKENTDATATGDTVVLTEYVYTGENKVVEAIYNYMKPDYINMFGDDSQVYIPAYVIYQEIDAGDEYLVFGDFHVYGYKLTGNILESESGATMSGCAHLKKAGDAYEVISIEYAGDGEMYEADLKEFTKNYPEIYDMYFDYQPERDDAIRREFLQMYVTDNNLMIEYYKDYGWEPVKIFE